MHLNKQKIKRLIFASMVKVLSTSLLKILLKIGPLLSKLLVSTGCGGMPLRVDDGEADNNKLAEKFKYIICCHDVLFPDDMFNLQQHRIRGS
jgi:hypothetical protein